MGLLDVRQILADLLEENKCFEKVMPLGNVVYVHKDNTEYEIVIRTVRPGLSLPITDPNTDGPVAQ